MNKEKLIETWVSEEKIAHIHGWDFSHIEGRFLNEYNLPWSYETIVKKYLSDNKKILDIDTGGAEFLLSLKHPYENTAATEGYAPNVELCKNKLLPLGVDFKAADARGSLPFPDESFDIVINRHGDFVPKEIHRILKSGGLFITEQVGAENDRELVELLLYKAPPLQFPNQYLDIVRKDFELQGFKTLASMEAYRPIKFFDIGALVWFAHIIEWEFPGFSVENCLSNLLHAQELLERDGEIQGQIHRFLLVVQK